MFLSCSGGDDEVFTIGILSVTERGLQVYEGFFDGMAAKGFQEGENVDYDLRISGFDPGEYRAVVRSFIEDEVDLILVSTTEAAAVAKEEARDSGIPIVFAYAFTENTGIVSSILSPGGNITGIRYPGPDISLKRFEVLTGILPEAKNIYVPYDPGYVASEIQFSVMKEIADQKNLNLIKAEAGDAFELERVLTAAIEEGSAVPDAVLTISGPLDSDPGVLAFLDSLSAEYGIPYGGTYVAGDGPGPIFGISSDFYETGRLTAPIVEKIINGTPANSIPVVSSNYFLQIDVRRAEMGGIEIPELLLMETDEIIR